VKQRSPLAPIFLIVLVDVLALTIMIPLLPFYTEAFGGTPLTVGILIGVFSACQLISGPILGNLSDRFGRRPLLLVSQFGMICSLLTMGFAQSLTWLFIGRIISGATAGNLTIAQAYITDHTKPEERTRAFGIIGIAFGFGFLIGPALSGVLARHAPDASRAELIDALSRPLFLSAGLSALSFVTTWVMLRDDVPRTGAADAAGPAGRRLGVLEWRGYLEYFRRPELAPLLFQFFFFCAAFAMFIGGFALFAERRYTWDGHPFTQTEVGYVYAYTGFLGMIVQGGLLKRLSARFGDARLVVWGFFLATVGYVALGFTYSIGMLLVVAGVSSFGSGILRPALTARVTRTVARHEQGVVLGLTQSLNSLALMLAPNVGNLLIEKKLLVWWAVLAAALSAVGLVLSAAASREPPALPDATLPTASGPG
jgi:DHA1 family tetracycline resistance protein-like MFS transporter